MKTALLIAYYFPPAPEVGSRRAEGFYRFLPDHGYRPIVVTASPLVSPRRDVHHAMPPARLAARILPAGGPSPQLPLRALLQRVYRETTFIPDAFRGFKGPAIEHALRIMRETRVDIVLAMSSPYTALAIGHALHRTTGCPWIADFRDLWVDNHCGYPYSPIRKRIDSALQDRWLSTCSMITTVTQGLVDRMEQVMPGIPVRRVSNGFLQWPPAPSPSPSVRNEGLSLCFTGTLYDIPGHSVSPLLAALDLLHSRAPELARAVRVEIYGHANEDLAISVRRSPSGRQLTHHGTVTTEAAARAQTESDVLVVLLPDTAEQRVSVPAKTFEYLTTRKPVLVIGPREGEAARLVQEVGAGSAFAPAEVEGIAGWIEGLLRRKRAGADLSCGDPGRIARHHYQILAGQLAACFEEATAARLARSRTGPDTRPPAET